MEKIFMDDKMKKIVTVILVIVIGIAAFAGYGYVTQKTTANEGIEYLNGKEYQKAYEKFHEAASKFTLFWTGQKTDTLLYEGESLYQLERYDDAIKVYDQLIAKGESRGYSFKAFCYMGKGETNKALNVCKQGIQALPDAGDIYCTEYGIYAKQKKYKEGLDILKKALIRDGLKNKQEVLFTRISAYESMFDYDTALQYAKAYVKAYPNDKQGKKELTFLETR